MSFSTDPDIHLREALNKGYVGARIEQGVPVLDRDLNLLGDLPLAMLRTLTAEFIGDGVREGNETFLIRATDADNDFEITGPGVLVVDGLQIRIPAPLRYSAQSTTPLTTPAGGREDLVYLDVLTEPALVDQTDDTDLENRSDVGQQTSVRLMAPWQVRVVEDGPIPPAPPGHRHIRLARLTRAAGDARIRSVADLRPELKTLQTVSERITELERIRTRVDDPVDGLDALVRRVADLEARVPRLYRVRVSSNEAAVRITLSTPAPERLIVFGVVHATEGRSSPDLHEMTSSLDPHVLGFTSASESHGLGSRKVMVTDDSDGTGDRRARPKVEPVDDAIWARWNGESALLPNQRLVAVWFAGAVELNIEPTNTEGEIDTNRVYVANLTVLAI